MSSIEILVVFGKLLAVMSAIIFVMFTGLAQWVYWTKNEKKDYPSMTKKFKMTYRFGEWEFRFFVAYAIVLLGFAIASATWHAVIKGF